MKQERRLNITKYQTDFAIAGRCSVCNHPFEVDFTAFDSVSAAEKEMNALFDAHNCDDPAVENA